MGINQRSHTFVPQRTSSMPQHRSACGVTQPHSYLLSIKRHENGGHPLVAVKTRDNGDRQRGGAGNATSCCSKPKTQRRGTFALRISPNYCLTSRYGR
jgi:hypothetical protein